ncbi:glycine betaine ABC transporter substrate-binding protein [Garciella nitratireducens]|uniref:glycine betaine ABC transporter substrate-binding protein n=1 Tax=Garciella nitratireducens TaxID=218205 RepID=UPI000E02D47B|nr:glycine betaine ABC transporter substrate-binding protein [Garciella nitratireducens]RBP46822.1 glycine betaine/proline transport system substrate-binding protein [Garciella nitratireducens]
MKKKWKKISIVMISILALLAVGCSNQEKQGTTSSQKDIESINLAYVAWDTEIASTNVIKTVLEDMGYDVEITQVENGPMWNAVATGKTDAIVAAWLPKTHADYYEDFKDDVDDLGPNLEGAAIGLVVPAYMKDVNSIEDLEKARDELNGTITGIDAGAGVVQAAEKAVKDYDLDFTVQTSSSAAMTQALGDAIQKKEPIVVTGWSPHWMFQKYDLKYLKDPKGSFGEAEKIHTVARKGLKEEKPEAYQILDQFYWKPEDMEKVMVKINEGMDPEKAAREWVNENQDLVSKWTAGVEKIK